MLKSSCEVGEKERDICSGWFFLEPVLELIRSLTLEESEKEIKGQA